MKHKASLLLMELLVMLLVFSLASALCLQVFAGAKAISQETLRRDQAVALARNAAELLKATSGHGTAVESLSREGYRVTAVPKPSSIPGLARAEVQVFFEGSLLFSLDTGWQEELP